MTIRPRERESHLPLAHGTPVMHAKHVWQTMDYSLFVAAGFSGAELRKYCQGRTVARNVATVMSATASEIHTRYS